MDAANEQAISTTANENTAPVSIITRPPITFFQLPAELRTYIYELAFTAPSRAVDLTDARRWAPNKGLLLSCKQAYFEARDLHAQAIPIFWSTARFEIPDLGRKRLMFRLKRQKACNLERIRQVKITIPYQGSSLEVTAEYIAEAITWQFTVSDRLPLPLSEARRNLVTALAFAADQVRQSLHMRRSHYIVGGITVKYEHVRVHEILALVEACRYFWVQAGGRKWRELSVKDHERKAKRYRGKARESHALVSHVLRSGHVKFPD